MEVMTKIKKKSVKKKKKKREKGGRLFGIGQ